MKKFTALLVSIVVLLSSIAAVNAQPLPAKKNVKAIKVLSPVKKMPLKPGLVKKPVKKIPVKKYHPIKKYNSKIVSLVSAECIKNNGVGNDWSYDVSVNGKSLNRHRSVRINSRTLIAYVKVVERDRGRLSDVGRATQRLHRGINTIYVKVIEDDNRGRPVTALWKVVIRVY